MQVRVLMGLGLGDHEAAEGAGDNSEDNRWYEQSFIFSCELEYRSPDMTQADEPHNGLSINMLT
jgi:hypothetical protein